MNTIFSYSKLLRLFYIVHMFTSLRLEVVWRTEQVIFYYIHKSNERGRQLFVIVMPRGFQVGDRVHLERDCIKHKIVLEIHDAVQSAFMNFA